MSNTQSSSSGCFSAVVRRLLCSGSPQTHPSEDIKESTTNGFVGDEAKVQVKASESGPGIVARLMGLDSLPEKNWVQKGNNPGPVTRSRSVNFMDYMLEFDLANAKHRRVKTSASFREVPQGPQLLQHNHNHDFLVVYLDSADKSNEAGLKPRKSEKGDGSSSKHDKQKENLREKVACKGENQEKNKKIAKLKNERRRVSGQHSLKAGSCISGAKDVQINRGANSKAKRPLKMVNQKEASVLTRKKKNQRELKKVEYSENNSEGSSPVSVLNVDDFTAHQENGISAESRSLELKSEKKWSSKSVKHDSPAMNFSARISITEGLGKQEYTKRNFESTGIEETEYYMELVGKPCKLTEEDIKFSNWIEPKTVFTFEDFEDICAEFGEQLLDLMMHQVADELVGFHMQITGL
ncbi:PREDICTED: uncharacterized protein LOC18597528 isoform X1 [Theobroma cacao]|uniref:Uncharacterized protein LOC18597528 isoform X1 n=1 Tax=Theobroma cacao TaxID=3641 RepID=A0AB32WJ04_THECC|nr:PREDICTED: uncharacterized protein LOC18597528 isoform X1 [Theobroma cacao]